MRLAKLTLTGFKSFADKTEFTFDDPITGVVGPNGCGKSNIVDAIKWVLGERSAKSLRGKEMLDVIFAGSSGRKPAGMASVVLTFDNPHLTPDEIESRDAERGFRARTADPDGETDGTDAETNGTSEVIARRNEAPRHLPIDTETVDVERRLYRDGTSQYLINGRKARLRDIRELFMDTGVGADAYSIIEQGRVDALLIANPKERRTFFEEAAGVARFKARRIESQRKLERAEVNLTRAREQLESTERRLRIVRGQATKARKFKALDTEHRALRAVIAFDQYHEIRERLDGLTSRMQDLDAQRETAVERLRRAEDEKQEAELTRHDLTERRREIERGLAEAEHAISAGSQRIEHAERSAAELDQEIERDDARMSDVRARGAELDESIDEQDRLTAELKRQASVAEDDLLRIATEKETVQSELAEVRLALSERRASAGEIERQRTAVTARLESDRARQRSLDESVGVLTGKRDELARERADVESDLSEAVAGSDARRARIGEIERTIEQSVHSSGTLSEDQRELARTVNELEQERTRIESRRSTLQEMDEHRAGLGDAVRRLLDSRDAEQPEEAEETEKDASVSRRLLDSIVAPLADVIEVNPDDALAVESALGANLGALLVRSLDDLTGQDFAELPGRVSFIPLAPEPVTRSDHAPTPGLEPVSARIRVRDEHRAAIDRLLGETYLVESLDSAMLLSAGPLAHVRARYVTRDGTIVEPDGRVIAGPHTSDEEGQGILQRRSELTELENQIAHTDMRLANVRASVDELDEKATELNERLAELRKEHAHEQRELVRDESTCQRLQADIERIDRESPRIAEELSEAQQKIEQLNDEQRGLSEKADSLARLLDEQKHQADQLETQADEVTQRLESLSERLTTAKVEAGQRGEKLASAEKELRRLRAAREDADRERERLGASIEQRRARAEEHRAEIEASRRTVDESTARRDEKKGALDELMKELESTAETASALAERVNAARERAEQLERDWNSLELSRRELEVRRENVEERALEDLSIDIEDEYFDYLGIIGPGDLAPIDREEATKQADEIRDAIRKLGNVNLDAIEEESSLEVRNEELIQQVADIDEARAQLETLIDRLNVASTDRFKEAFETIQSNFSGRDGMFRKLFGGGRAEIRLIPDEETGEVDWLESGIEITAKPPGKEPRTISQLSGGEKSLTAVALLLSIFQSKPSPFCVLDEVDAALDDSNVERYSRVITEFLEHCHFIVITHNKRTMQIADALFGVTMQERGVSRRVRVKFDDISHGGHIRGDRATELKPSGVASNA